MKRHKLLMSLITLTFALIICAGGVVGVVAALKAEYKITGTVSYTAQHINADVTYKKYSTSGTTALTSATVETANYGTGETVNSTSFNQSAEGTKTIGEQTYNFTDDIVAYKIELVVKNNANFAITATLTVTPNTISNLLIHPTGVTNNKVNIPASGTGDTVTIAVYLAIVARETNIGSTGINISLDLSRAAS